MKKNTRLTGSAEGQHPLTVASAQTEGHWQAFEDMFLASRTKFLGLAYRILRNREDAEDAVQNALVSAYVHLHSFDGRSALSTWFTRVVLNASLMIRRKRRASHIEFIPESASAGDDFTMDSLPTSKPDPLMQYEHSETLALVDDFIRKLSPTLRQAFTMAYFDELSPKHAGALLGVSPGTFKSRLFRARRYLMRYARRSAVVPVPAARLPFSRSENGFMAAAPAAISSQAAAF